MLKKLLNLKKTDGTELKKDEIIWLANVVGGAIVSDGKIQAEEKEYLQNIFQAFQEKPEALMAFKNVIAKKAPNTVENIKFDEAYSELILRTLLEITAADHVLSAGEIRFVNEVSMALEFSVLKTHKLINRTARIVKVEFFNNLIKDLVENEKEWLAHVVLRSIYADGHLDKHEISYLNDVFDLLNGDKAKLDLIKKTSGIQTLSDLKPVELSDSISHRVISYLVDITMGDNNFEDAEYDFLKEVAKHLNYDKDKLDKLVESKQISLIFMESSQELLDLNEEGLME